MEPVNNKPSLKHDRKPLQIEPILSRMNNKKEEEAVNFYLSCHSSLNLLRFRLPCVRHFSIESESTEN